MNDIIFDNAFLGEIKLKNRIIRSATHDGLADENGAPTLELIKKYEFLAKNEVGCIITGYAGVSKNGLSPYPKMLRIDSDDYIDKYKLLTHSVHKYDTPIVIQLAHCGRQTSTKAIGVQKVAPSAKRHLFYPDKAEELSKSQIQNNKADFVSMCRPFICEPNLVKKLKDGIQSESKCIMCNFCGLVIEKESTKCLMGRV